MRPTFCTASEEDLVPSVQPTVLGFRNSSPEQRVTGRIEGGFDGVLALIAAL